MAQLKSYIQFLGSGTGDSGPTILLWFDKKRYLFNCSEGTQRFCSEYHVKPSKLDTFFFTRLTWENVGGLAGILFVAAGLGSNNVNIYGPPNTVNFIEAMRYFLSRHKLTMNAKEFRDTSPNSEECFQDEFVKVYPIPLIDMSEVERFSSMYPSTPLQSSTELRDQDDLGLEHAGLRPKVASQIQKVDESGFGLNKGFKMVNSQVRTPRPPGWSWPPKESIVPPLRKLTIDTMPLNAVICYAIHTADAPGKFDVAKAAELGVPVKQRSHLVKGLPVTLENGTVIQPSDCIGPSKPGKVVLIVDAPNIAILHVLIASQRFAPYQNGLSGAAPGKFFEHVTCIVHITPADILTSPPYQEWMNRFHGDTQHVILNSDHCASPYVYQSSARLQYLLNHIHTDIFPLQYQDTQPSSPLPKNEGQNLWPSKIISAVPMLRFGLAPHNMIGLEHSMLVPPLDPAQIIGSIKDNAELQSALKLARDELSRLPARPPLAEDPVDVVFLGTGSATPSKYRNQSSTYVNVRGYGGLLLDAGEGTLGQLSRHFGPHLDEAISNLKCVFISHMHADHHLGLMRVILKHQSLTTEPLLIVGPPLLRGWLFEYRQIEHISYVIADNYDFCSIVDHLPVDLKASGATPSSSAATTPAATSSAEASSGPTHSKPEKFVSAGRKNSLALLKEKLGIVDLSMAPVIHCMDAFGMAIVHENGWKLVFSGDTRPCDTLVEAGMGATLLIHEATFEDSLAKEAEHKAHATTSEAIEVANAMGAKFLMMTHFSQRYPKIPVFDTSSGKTGAGIAFDLMKMKFSDFDIIPKLTTCLQLLFADAPESDAEDDVVVEVD
jgi:ribonuclease Z